MHKASSRIWIIDKLHPGKSLKEVEQLAIDESDRIYDEDNRYLAFNDAFKFREGRMPTHFKLNLMNGEVINIFELYFEVREDLEEHGVYFNVNRELCKHFLDRTSFYDGPASRDIVAPDGKCLLQLCDDLEGYCKGTGEKSITKTINGDQITYVSIDEPDWMYDNPEWDFKKIVLDNIEPYIINADLNA